MVARPYHTSRQQHLGDMLDHLQSRGYLQWHWDYTDSSRAVFVISINQERPQRLYIRPAEHLVQALTTRLRIPWVPVPPPGGETQLHDTELKIALMTDGKFPPPWATDIELD